jgi:hypothetical protein
MGLVLWEKRRRGRKGLFDEVSVNAITISLGENFTKYFNKKYVEFYYNREKRIIVLKPVDTGYTGYSISKQGRYQSMFAIRALGIISYLKIRPDWYKAQWDPKTGMLQFEYEEKKEVK